MASSPSTGLRARDSVATSAAVADPRGRELAQQAMDDVLAGVLPHDETELALSPANVEDWDARQLFTPYHPLDPASYGEIQVRPVRHFYAPSVIRTSQRKLVDVCVNHKVLAFQGAAIGVGATQFLVDYANTYNYTAEQWGMPHRIVHYDVPPDTKSATKFLEDIAAVVNAPLKPSDFRHGMRKLTLRIVAAAWSAGLVALFLDHTHRLALPVLEVLSYLIAALDPKKHVRTQFGATPLAPPRVGLVLASHRPPETLYRDYPELEAQLDGRHTVLPPYTSMAQIAEALQRAGIGLDDFALDSPEGEAIAAQVLKTTDGLTVEMARYLEWVAALARANGRSYPTLVDFVQAPRLHRRFVRLVVATTGGEMGRPVERHYETVPVRFDAPRRGRMKPVGEGDAAAPLPDLREPRRKGTRNAERRGADGDESEVEADGDAAPASPSPGKSRRKPTAREVEIRNRKENRAQSDKVARQLARRGASRRSK